MFARSKRQDVHVAAKEINRRKHRIATSSSFEELSSIPKPTQSTSIQTDLRVVYLTENDVGRPGDDRRRTADERCDDRQADVGAQEQRTTGLAYSAQPKAPSSTNVYTEIPEERPVVREEHSTTSAGCLNHSSRPWSSDEGRSVERSFATQRSTRLK